jgi:transcriptional regulator with XRE-family HTH domain
MNLRRNFGHALRAARKMRNLPQEALDNVSSRTYVSTLERGLKSPTLDKIAQLAEALDVHPLTLLIFGFVGKQPEQHIDSLLQQIKAEYQLLVAEDSD